MATVSNAGARPAVRHARLELTNLGAKQVLTVALPRDVNARELASVNTVIVDKVIKDLTGCACLSGIIDVLYQGHFEKVINVDLANGGIIGG
jgi:hypothetical protein